MSLKDWIQRGRELGASDLHLESGTPLVARIRGDLAAVGEPISGRRITEVAQELLGAEAWAQFLERGSADVSMAVGGMRCRLSLFRTIRGVAVAVRLLAPSVNDLRACNLHPDLRKLVEAESGLAVISGPTGSGKSPLLHPATRDPDALPHVRASRNRCAAREPRCARDERDAYP